MIIIYTLNINRIRKIVSFKLGKEIEKDFFHLVMSVGKRKKFGVPVRNGTSGLLDSAFQCSTTEP